MSNKKLSSVDFYRIESQKLIIKALRKEIPRKEWVLLENKLGEQAKAMHKEEVAHSYRCGAAEVGMVAINKPEQYYNETFKGNNEQQETK